MPFRIILGDITKLRVDAIVNTANTELLMGAGVCGAVFSAAGADRLHEACSKIAPIKTGEAVITSGFDLHAKYIIHTAGPVYHDGKQGEETLLRSSYTNSLELAAKHGCESIAFPLISSGVYGYPKAEALRVASDAIRDFITNREGDDGFDIDVSLVIFDKATFVVGGELLGAVESYVGEHYVQEEHTERRGPPDVERKASYNEGVMNLGAPMHGPKPSPKLRPKPSKTPIAEAAVFVAEQTSYKLDDLVGNLDEPFSAMLLQLIDATGKKDAEVYRRANIDRRLFSKIRSNANYAPSKPTVLAFAVALELSIDQTADLLGRAGFALSRSRLFDVIVEFFIKSRKYDIFRINEVLFNYDQPLLGG